MILINQGNNNNNTDPLSATLVTASDDPLFSSSKAQSQSSRTNSPSIANDPLSRPTDTSSSTPLSPASRSSATAAKKSSPSSSIFGDIDVSKLGTSNGKKHTVRSPALRGKQYDLEDEEDLFGGGGHRTRKPSKVTTPTPSVAKSPTTQQQDIPALKKTSASPAPSSAPLVPSSPVIQQQKSPVVQQRQPTVSKPVMEQPAASKSETPANKEEKPTVSSSSSSFFRFFKSSNNSNSNSKNSSSASSIASVNAPSPIVAKNHDTVNSTTTATTPALPPPAAAPVPPVRQPAPPVPAPASLQQQQPMYRPNGIQQRQVLLEEQEEEEEEEEPVPIIEDEATRAFAEDNVISFTPSLSSYRSISPELTMDALKIDIPPAHHISKKLVPSISTPTNNVDDPWSNPLLMQPTVEPSISSPLAVKVQDIEPQKRTAFADLINSWNTGKSNTKEYHTNSQDPKEFFDHVAEERRDIGFAGIREHEDDSEDDDDEEDEQQQDHYRRPQQLDYQDEINPWN